MVGGGLYNGAPEDVRMPSRHAHLAAARRSQEPALVAPACLPELPPLPGDALGWRNPREGEHFLRNRWHICFDHPAAPFVLSSVTQLDDGSFDVRSGTARARVEDPQAAFELAAGWAMAADVAPLLAR